MAMEPWIVRQRVVQRGPHGRLPRCLVLHEVVDVAVLRLDHRGVAPRAGRDQVVVREDCAPQCPYQVWGVLVRLDDVAEATVVAAPPREHPGNAQGPLHWGLDRHDVVLPAGRVPQHNRARILQADALHPTLRISGPGGHHAAQHPVPVALALHEHQSPHELGAVSLPELPSRDNVLPRLAVAPLAELGLASHVEVPG